ncbi:MAG TPA: HD domain-containing phosphohydrolase [Bryobacteraceae bacterium]|nr:HD domain-containing phosphohydrolase [Bryobacteraceae bacterium]
MREKRVLPRMRQIFAHIHLLAHIAIGSAIIFWTLLNWQSHDHLQFFSFLGATILASVLKVRLPGVDGTVSVNALFILVGIVNLSLPEALALGVVSIFVQCTWRPKSRPKPIQVLFNVCSMATAVYVTARLYEYSHSHLPEPAGLGLLALSYFFANSFPIAGVIGLSEKKSVFAVWAGCRWLLPYYVVGSSMAWLIGTMPRSIQWELPIICLPLVYLVHRSNRTHMTQVEQENKHVGQMNSLHLRTIEALALAIDAKDHTTHDHLQRVQLYALEIGKDLGLTEIELDALRAAAVLHDIGKLAVPEHIISKPGKLTRAEFEKMKIHPVVGAEILERVEFPYPVVPIVRSHHEKWDGSGYPHGLKGTEIPIGARILAAVDCLDALASDRQYRRALPLDEAMGKVVSEAGTAFDPAVVRALHARYQELEARAKATRVDPPPSLSKDIKITRGAAPAAGFAVEAAPEKESATQMHPVARARKASANESWSFDLSDSGLGSLRSEEALAVAALRLKALVPYDAIAFYVSADGMARPRFVSGDDQRLLSSLCVPLGQGLVGWVADVGKPILNGNPTVEPGYVANGTAAPTLSSALALPLEDSGRVAGVLALYRAAKDAFTAEELLSLAPLCPAIAPIVAERQVDSAGTRNLAIAVGVSEVSEAPVAVAAD